MFENSNIDLIPKDEWHKFRDQVAQIAQILHKLLVFSDIKSVKNWLLASPRRQSVPSLAIVSFGPINQGMLQIGGIHQGAKFELSSIFEWKQLFFRIRIVK